MNENKIYGYCRISTSKQNIDRQIRNIKNEYPTAIIYQEVFTGTKTLSRKKWQQLLKIVRTGDTIVFDSVSRMSRDADSGIQLYLELFDKGINLVFIKEHFIDTDTYRKAITESIDTTGNEIADIYIEATNKVIKLYNVPSAAERNTYEINIPSSVDISYGETEKEIPITINDNYNLESSYTVYVDVAKSTFNTNPESNIYKYVRLYNASTSNYYYALELKNSNDNQLYYKYNDDTTKNLCVASFHSDSSQNTGGILKLSYVGEKSNDTSYHDSASYTGSITFDIYGEYK